MDVILCLFLLVPRRAKSQKEVMARLALQEDTKPNSRHVMCDTYCHCLLPSPIATADCYCMVGGGSGLCGLGGWRRAMLKGFECGWRRAMLKGFSRSVGRSDSYANITW